MSNPYKNPFTPLLDVLGIVLILTGIAFSVPLIPGPGILLIAAGLFLLAPRYGWAKNWQDKILKLVQRIRHKK